ncbi:MAG: helix-turn-helix domain-containing protein [Deltaproteobacteria bacterium]|jgi:transposase|nr:helix-turn-helix domain-containing protein [Deltaproteobacteria bacterium]
MVRRYVISLTTPQRDELTKLAKTRKGNGRKALFYRALLLSEIKPGGPGWPAKKICAALGFGERTLIRLKKRFVEEGLSSAIERKEPNAKKPALKLDGAFETKLMALASSPPPEGQARWTLRLLAQKAMELKYVEAVSVMSIHRILKKSNFDLPKGGAGKAPGKAPRKNQASGSA